MSHFINKEKQSYDILKLLLKSIKEYLMNSSKDSYTITRGITYLILSICSLAIPSFLIQLSIHYYSYCLIHHIELKFIFIMLYFLIAFLILMGLCISCICLIEFLINILFSMYYGIKGSGK